MANKVYGIVLENILKAMEMGIVPWQKPWKGGANQDQNILTKIPYHGVNILLLNIISHIYGYKHPYWITWKQAKKKGWSFKSGSKSNLIVFFKKYEYKKNEDGDEDEEQTENRVRRVLRYYRVFNIEYIEDYENIFKQELEIPVVSNEDRNLDSKASMLYYYLRGKNINIKYDQQRSYYSVSDDFINMPQKTSFVSQDAFYASLAHEIVHSTGISNRLNRFSNAYDNYSHEELVAEIGSALLCAEMGIKVDYKNTASYLDGWSKYLSRSKKTEIFSAAKDAEKAVEYIKKSAVEGAIKNSLKEVA